MPNSPQSMVVCTRKARNTPYIPPLLPSPFAALYPLPSALGVSLVHAYLSSTHPPPPLILIPVPCLAWPCLILPLLLSHPLRIHRSPCPSLQTLPPLANGGTKQCLSSEACGVNGQSTLAWRAPGAGRREPLGPIRPSRRCGAEDEEPIRDGDRFPAGRDKAPGSLATYNRDSRTPEHQNSTTPQHHNMSPSNQSRIHSSVQRHARRVVPCHCVAASASASTPMWWCRAPGITSLSFRLPQKACQVVAGPPKMAFESLIPDT